MKKGDWVVCVHHRFANFTKGKKYQLQSDKNGSILDIINDNGERGHPSYYGIEGTKGYPAEDKVIFYFMSIEDVRDKKLNQLGI